MKFNKRLSYHEDTSSMANNKSRIARKKVRISPSKKVRYREKQDLSTTQFSLIKSSPYIDELENEFMNVLKNKQNTSELRNCQYHRNNSNLVDHFNLNNSLRQIIDECNHYRTTFYAKRRLLITRSVNDFARKSIEPYVDSFLSSEYVHRSCLKNTIQLSNVSTNTASHGNERKPSLNHTVSFYWNENSLRNACQQHDAAIIEFEQQTRTSTSSSSTAFVETIDKSFSCPLPLSARHSCTTSNNIQSAHVIEEYPYRETNETCSYSTIYDRKSISSDDENVHQSFECHMKKRNAHHRWSLLDIWATTKTKLPPVFNCVWQQPLYRTDSREFLLEYDQTLTINNNNNNNNNNKNSRSDVNHEQRYVEQERPINNHLGVALLALLVFPPVGILALTLSVWSLCGRQDRHLSRKFGNAAYGISLFSIFLSIFLLLTLFMYFTYEYVIHRPIIISSYAISHKTRRSPKLKI